MVSMDRPEMESRPYEFLLQFCHFRTNRRGNNGNSETLFSWAPKSPQMVTAAMKLKKNDAFSVEEKLRPT